MPRLFFAIAIPALGTGSAFVDEERRPVPGNLPPGGGYEEIGTLTPSDGAAYTPDEFKTKVRAHVCEGGGDVVFTEIIGLGQYARGTILRATGASADAEATKTAQ
jgi:hypothetical protein